MTNPIRILFIEDDIEDYRFIESIFAAIPRGSYHLDWVSTYDEALAQIRQKQHDLYLVDYLLGGQSDGLQLIRDAFPNGCDRAVILLTAHGAKEIDETALQLGVAEYFDKVHIRAPLLERAVRYAINSKRVEAELRDSEARYRMLIEAAPDYICQLDTDQRIQQINPSVIRESGYQSAEIIGKPLREFLTPLSQSVLDEMFPRLLATGHCRQEIEFRRKDGSVQVMDCSGSILKDREKVSAVVILRDITRRKQAEHALELALGREKELNELKSRFVSMVSHEFRSPLAAIRLWSEMLRTFRHKMDDTAIDSKLASIMSQIDHLAILVNDVLSLSRMETGQVELKPTTADLDVFCQQIAEETADRYRQTHHLVCDLPTSRIPARIDTTLMRQVMVNLLENAFKYSPQGGTVRLSVALNGDGAIVSVSDSGIGIPESDQRFLFDPFYRATNVGAVTGTGLGLAIVKQAVELHGGRIEVESQIGAGSTFRLRLPVVPSG